MNRWVVSAWKGYLGGLWPTVGIVGGGGDTEALVSRSNWSVAATRKYRAGATNQPACSYGKRKQERNNKNEAFKS